MPLPIWAIVLIYTLIVLLYLVVQQMIFKYRFKEGAFTVLFLDAISFLISCFTAFDPLFTWIMVANIMMTVGYAIYVNLMMRHIRRRIRKQVESGEMDMESMIKNIMGGFPFGERPDAGDLPPDFINSIKVSEEPLKTDDENVGSDSDDSGDGVLRPEDFDNGNGIIDENDDRESGDDDRKN